MAQQRTPPELLSDAVGEILLRIPPDSSAYLARASKVCKLWRRIVSDPDFTRRYREFNRTPPLLGFFHNSDNSGPLFCPTMPACPSFPQPVFDSSHWLTLDDRQPWALDCRHGRVLLRHSDPSILLVWNPITGGREEVPLPQMPHEYYQAMVLCVTVGCDHCNCLGGPFMVIFVGSRGRSIHGCVYSLKARAWGTTFSATIRGGYYYIPRTHGVLVRDHAYFTLRKVVFREHACVTGCMATKILKYDLGENFFLYG
ncbi:unnamed protein product [Urochloa humidicola]